MNSSIRPFLATAALLTAACTDFGLTSGKPDDASGGPKFVPVPMDSGTAQVTVVLDPVGALGKRSDIALSRLCLALSAMGADSIFDTLAVSGNGRNSVSKTYAKLASMRSWKLTAKSLDLKDSVIHAGSVSFDVQPGKTADVSLDLTARFAMLKARFFPIKDSVTRCSLYIDGALMSQSAFAKQTLLGDTLKLAYDYVLIFATHKIRMEVYGSMWGLDTLLYSGDTTIALKAGDADYRMKLDWKGPYLPPAGQASIQVLLGAAPTVTVNGELPESYKTRGLVAYYPFTGDARDMSGNGHDAILTGAALTKDRFGDANRAYHFNGIGDRMEVPEAPGLDLDTAVTVLCWAKPERITGLATLVGKWYSPDNFLLLIQDGQFVFSVSLNGGDWGAVYSVKADIKHPGQWSHVAGVFDGKNITLYVDGRAAASAAAPGRLQASDRPLTMGNHPEWNAYLGDLDAVRIYKRALKADEMGGLFWDGLYTR